MDAVTEDTRATLRDAIAVRGRAYENHQKSKAALARCDELLQKAEADVRQLGDVDGEVAQYRAQRVRAQLDEGGAVAIATLPRELSDKVRARDGLKAHSRAVRDTRDALASELSAAERNFAVSQNAVEVAALAVLLQRAGELSDEMRRARERVAELYGELSALSTSWFRGADGRAGPAPLPIGVRGEMELALPCVENELVRRTKILRSPGAPDDAKARWRQAHEALCTDADAALPDA